MNFPTSLIQIFRHHAATIRPEDANVEVSPDLAMVLEIPETIALSTFAVTGTEIKRSSFWTTQQSTVANGALFDDVVAFVGPGLWDLTVMVNYISNNTNLAEFGEAYLSDLAGTAGGSIVRFRSIANVNANYFAKFRIAHDLQDGLLISGFLSANGAGDSHSLDVNLLGNRLG